REGQQGDDGFEERKADHHGDSSLRKDESTTVGESGKPIQPERGRAAWLRLDHGDWAGIAPMDGLPGRRLALPMSVLPSRRHALGSSRDAKALRRVRVRLLSRGRVLPGSDGGGLFSRSLLG